MYIKWFFYQWGMCDDETEQKSSSVIFALNSI